MAPTGFFGTFLTSGARSAPRTFAGSGIGLAAGAVLGVLAVPFHRAVFASVAAGPMGSLVHVASRALADVSCCDSSSSQARSTALLAVTLVM